MRRSAPVRAAPSWCSESRISPFFPGLKFQCCTYIATAIPGVWVKHEDRPHIFLRGEHDLQNTLHPFGASYRSRNLWNHELRCLQLRMSPGVRGKSSSQPVSPGARSGERSDLRDLQTLLRGRQRGNVREGMRQTGLQDGSHHRA